MTSKIFSLVLAVATLLLSTTISPSSASWFHRPRYYVHIINELSQHEMMFVSCNSTDAPQPFSYISVGSKYEWSFKEHWFGPTIWTCYLSPDNNRHVKFVAYQLRQPNYKDNVYWLVREDGVYSWFPDVPERLQFTWEPGH
ncbi:S-protein homolog 8 [Linum grandiflorum]